MIRVLLCALLVSTALAVPSRPRQPVPPGGFKNCAQARAAGYISMRRGEPGYSKKLDRDHDGIACEPKQR
ncbi:excalibur calcium-binding domain-containing protein [Deinococcus altitudinis]|uniref:excalibur calcium-binding domain-containing protein n=1 Tax=Deinococcus altitudinis TaxID=468914 RepID=UPI0038927A0E